MNHNLDDVELFSDVVSLISRPNHGYCSFNGISKRLRCNDDKIRRAFSRLETWAGTQLAKTEQGRLTPTDAGRRLYQLAQDLRKFRLTSTTDAAAENIVLEIDEELASLLLPRLLNRFMETWANQICLKICALNVGKVRGNIVAGLTTFGCGLDTVGSSAASQILDPHYGWCLLAAKELNITGKEAPLEIARRYTLFLPAPERQPEGLETALRAAALSNRVVECNNVEAIRSCVKNRLGVGIIPNLPFVNGDEEDSAICSFALRDLGEPLAVRLYLPRTIEQMSDPAQVLVESIRQAVVSFRPALSSVSVQAPSVDEALSEQNVLVGQG